MTNSPELLSLRNALITCLGHGQALKEALNDLAKRDFGTDDLDLERLTKDDRRLLDQFAYRYTRLQDDMGSRLIPATLRMLEEEIASMAMLDRLNRLEQLGWLPSAEEWIRLRAIRNEFTHDYPEDVAERYERLELAIISAKRLRELIAGFERKVKERWPGGQMPGFL
ncbi:hypothetical protein [Sedimenticola hydrogenitrophicus]|uniref:hypothetical protein n=1 Tax=Sedimenticola hydrogenitrophicus TaxID=2967975 RepID=UPI0021A4DE2F|nr:hypothetical protein [Sedimenticola hydrogenitrophicus]